MFKMLIAGAALIGSAAAMPDVSPAALQAAKVQAAAADPTEFVHMKADIEDLKSAVKELQAAKESVAASAVLPAAGAPRDHNQRQEMVLMSVY